ncbi:MAG: DUF692 domain-containing protein [Deltaproteobacteria bacterium]|nr:DUF692 domain-containing protein [Deltaproteobacteria bacterium]
MIEKPSIGVGLGLRREISLNLVQELPQSLDCLEVAPENYLGTGGKFWRQLCALGERYPILFHGISLTSLGTLEDFDWDLLKQAKKLADQFNSPWMSDHLCYSSVKGFQFHDLLPLPFTEEAIKHVVPKIKTLQDFFEKPFAIENISYYAHPGKAEMSEWEFVARIAELADCALLLDVNNIYVNSVNHRFEAKAYIDALPLERVLQVHVAGHRVMEDFLLDTHGASVIDPVWDLLSYLATKTSLPAVIVERDNNLPDLQELIKEVEIAKKVIRQANDHKTN